MSKLAPQKDVGVPVPSPAPAAGTHLIAYYGAQGFTPSYSQVARVDLGDVSTLKTVSQSNSATPPVTTTYYDLTEASILPAGTPAGNYDVVFTLMDSAGDESDFSPAVTVTLPSAPPTLGQPILLG